MLMNVTSDHVVLLNEDASQMAVKRSVLESADQKIANDFLQRIADLRAPIDSERVGRGVEIRHGEVPAQLPIFPAMSFDATLQNGVPHGLAQFRSTTGSLCQVEPQKNGQLHGTKVQFYRSGEVYALIFMDTGTPVGVHPRFFPNGLVATLTSWENGEQHGFYITYHKNGRKKDVYPLVHGKRQGQSVHFTSAGLHYAVQNWENDAAVNQVVLHEIGADEYADIVSSNIPQFGEVWSANR
jgi:hypothetical protein